MANERAGFPDARLPVDDGPVLLPLVEEQALLSKREIEGDRVRITTATEMVEEIVRETLRSEGLTVRRVPVNRTLNAGEVAPTMRREGQTTIIPVLEEVLVVEKRLLLKEEIHLIEVTSTEDIEVPVTLRKQRAVIERTGPDGRITRHQQEEV